jgi:recombination protein RecR
VNSIDKLSEIFAHFPGIGPRQAKRFVYYLLSQNNGSIDELSRSIQNLKKEIARCEECMRHFPRNGYDVSNCSVCSDDTRSGSLLCVVPRDIDFEAIEKGGIYKGYYFILGGSLPILEKDPKKRIRINELKSRIKKGIVRGLEEVILAMNANADGENTADYLRDELKDFNIGISTLGRGLSTGAELEYSDPETLKNAFLHRTK